MKNCRENSGKSRADSKVLKIRLKMCAEQYSEKIAIDLKSRIQTFSLKISGGVINTVFLSAVYMIDHPRKILFHFLPQMISYPTK